MCLGSAGSGQGIRLEKEAKGNSKGPSLEAWGWGNPWAGSPQQTLRLGLWAGPLVRVPKHTEGLHCLRIPVAPNHLSDVSHRVLLSLRSMTLSTPHTSVQHLLCAQPQVAAAQTLRGVDQHGVVALGSERCRFKSPLSSNRRSQKLTHLADPCFSHPGSFPRNTPTVTVF